MEDFASADRLSPDRGKVFEWKNMLAGGVVGGLLAAAIQMVMASLSGHGLWHPVNMVAAILLGADLAVPPATFVPGWVATGFALHLLLSAIFAIPLGAMIQRARRHTAMGVGAAYGAVLFLINLYLFTAVFPWFAQARSPVTLLSHLAYGFTAAYVCKALDARSDRRLHELRHAPSAEYAPIRAARPRRQTEASHRA